MISTQTIQSNLTTKNEGLEAFMKKMRKTYPESQSAEDISAFILLKMGEVSEFHVDGEESDEYLALGRLWSEYCDLAIPIAQLSAKIANQTLIKARNNLHS